MRDVLRVFAVLLTIFTIVVLLMAVGMFIFRATLLNQAFLTQELDRYEVYAQIPELAIVMQKEQVAFSENPVVQEEFARNFDHEQWLQVFTQFLPPEWIQSQTEHNLDALFRWLDGETDYPRVKWDMTHIQDQFQREDIHQMLPILLAHLPPCETEQNPEAVEHHDCRPSAEDSKELLPYILPILQEEFPRVLSLQNSVEAGEMSAENQRQLHEIRRSYQYFIRISSGIWGMSVLFIVIIVLMAARSSEQVLRWAGWPLTISGGLALVGLGFFYVAVPVSIERMFAEMPPEAALSPLISFSGTFVSGSIRDISVQGVGAAVTLFLIGIAALTGAAIVRRFAVIE